MNKFFLMAAFCSLLSLPAMADQCQWNDRGTAQAARQIMVQHDFLYSYCEPCGDRKIREIKVGRDNENTLDKKAIHFRRQASLTGTTYWQFEVNEGQSNAATLDLAYTYVYENGILVNVGHKVNCGARSVSPRLPWDPSKVVCDGACG